MPLFCPMLFAQQTLLPADDTRDYRDARQWFAEGNYALSYPVFKRMEHQFGQRVPMAYELAMDEIRFFSIACELQLENAAAENNARQYLKTVQSEGLRASMSVHLGRYYFRKENHAAVAEAFAQTNPDNLSAKDKDAWLFEYGYSLFTQRKLKEAKPLLDEVRRNASSPYYTDGNYYYGLLAYADGQYKEALACFDIAALNAKYQPLTPYYNASIQYALGNKDKGLELAERALKSGNTLYTTELNQLAGHAWFEKGNYEKALPYLEKYVNSSAKVKREDLYELASCYYHQKQYAKAIEGFKPLSSGQDSLTQHAMYLLGDAYLQTNDKANARTAFIFCAGNSSNPAIRESSIFHAGKLAHDLGLDNEAIIALKQYLATYPTGRFKAEGQDLLVAALANTSNYREALQLYESLPAQTATNRKLLPKLLYNRAQEEINDGKDGAAETLLNRALGLPDNEEVKPLLYFWKAELAYRKADYATAAQYLQDYLKKPLVNAEANADNARYTLGYCQLMMQQYAAAQQTWESLQQARFANPAQKQDAAIRLADAYFMQKNFGKAKPLYTEGLTNRTPFADYALYQLGVIAGAENRTDQKIKELERIEKEYPNSVYAPMANMEIAKTYLADEVYKNAIGWLNKVIAAKSGESLKPAAWLKLGLAQYNLGNNNDALNSFSALLKAYPESPEADEAVDNVRSILIEQGKAGEFITFMNNAGRRLDGAVADSLSFVAAELLMSEGKKEQALNGFTGYLKQFPQGRYVLPATWFAAELYRGKKDMPGAISLYEKLIAAAPNKYVEGALIQVARYHYFDKTDYKKAMGYYRQLSEVASNQENRLEAMRGLVRCQYYSGDVADATANAQNLLGQKGIGGDDKIFANLVLGKSAQQSNNCPEAIKYYNAVAALSKAAYGAEARYGIAECLLAQDKLTDAETAAFEVIKKSGSYAEWVTKAYLLLGDIFMKQKDYFNAKATYKSVAENSSIPALKAEAAARLEKAEKEEQAQSKLGTDNQ